ncbi:MAG: hypothetical protein MI924_23495, partial [Chloroflexales bacterium]|nr:hypothetical protein [Chloroflexales bacterium]
GTPFTFKPTNPQPQPVPGPVPHPIALPVPQPAPEPDPTPKPKFEVPGDPRIDDPTEPCPTPTPGTPTPTPGTPTPTPDDAGQQVTVYRGLGGELSKDKSYYKKPYVNPGAFFRGIDRDPDGSSTYQLAYLPGNQPYMAAFSVWIRKNYQEGDSGTVLGSQVYNGVHCTATFTPSIDPPDHWSINCNPREQTGQALAFLTRSEHLANVSENPHWTGTPLDRRIPKN